MEFTFSVQRLIIQSDFAPIISILILIAFIKTNINFSDKVNHFFYISCVAAILLTFSDNLRFITAHMAHPTILRYISAGLGYTLRPLILYTISTIVTRHKRLNPYITAIPLLICAAVSLVSMTHYSNGIMFSFNAENKFVRGPLGFLPHVVSAIYAFQIIFYSLKNLNDNKLEPIAIIIMSTAAVTATFLENKFKYDFILSQVFISSIIYYYFFLMTQAFKRDPLTGFLNRRCFYLELNHLLKTPMVLLSMDLNNLKIYNDTMGHAAGDRALSTASAVMNDIFSKHAILYRTGGDEFMAIFIKQDIVLVQKLVEDFQSALHATEYRVACGFAQYTPGDNIEKVITLSDEKMYTNKVNLKNSENIKKI